MAQPPAPRNHKLERQTWQRAITPCPVPILPRVHIRSSFNTPCPLRVGNWCAMGTIWISMVHHMPTLPLLSSSWSSVSSQVVRSKLHPGFKLDSLANLTARGGEYTSDTSLTANVCITSFNCPVRLPILWFVELGGNISLMSNNCFSVCAIIVCNSLNTSAAHVSLCLLAMATPACVWGLDVLFARRHNANHYASCCSKLPQPTQPLTTEPSHRYDILAVPVA